MKKGLLTLIVISLAALLFLVSLIMGGGAGMAASLARSRCAAAFVSAGTRSAGGPPTASGLLYLGGGFHDRAEILGMRFFERFEIFAHGYLGLDGIKLPGRRHFKTGLQHLAGALVITHHCVEAGGIA